MELTIQKINQGITATTVLRSYPGFLIDLANEINLAGFKLKEQIKGFEQETELLNERIGEIEKMPSETPDELKSKEAAVSDHNKAINKIYKKIYKFDLQPIPLERFNGIEINGEKETIQANGHIVKFNYRDCFYDLQELGVIAI